MPAGIAKLVRVGTPLVGAPRSRRPPVIPKTPSVIPKPPSVIPKRSEESQTYALGRYPNPFAPVSMPAPYSIRGTGQALSLSKG